MELVIRATVIYWFLWLIVRGTGKRSISELTPLELLFTFAAWMLTSDFLTHRSKRWERILEGEAVVVLRDGVPHGRRALRRSMTFNSPYSSTTASSALSATTR